MYVVAIQLDDNTTDYKAFEKSTDAIARLDRYHVGQTVHKRDKSAVEILSISMYKAKTADVREAVRLVKAGEAERFYKPSSPELDAL